MAIDARVTVFSVGFLGESTIRPRPTDWIDGADTNAPWHRRGAFRTVPARRDDSGYGVATYAEGQVVPRFTAGTGFASIGNRILNSNRFGRGERFFVTGHLALSSEVVLDAT